MPTIAFTTQRLNSIKPAPSGKRVEYRDHLVPGLVLRVTDTGSKTFSVFTWVPARRRPERITLDKWPRLSIDAARKRAREIIGGVAQAAARPRTSGDCTTR